MCPIGQRTPRQAGATLVAVDRTVAVARRRVTTEGRRQQSPAASRRVPAGWGSPLLDLQHAAGNAAVGQLLSAQRATAAEFAIRGKFADSASHPNLIFFDMNSATLDLDEHGKIPARFEPFAITN